MRPVIQGQAQGADGTWLDVALLVDVGADQTVFSADVLRALGFSMQSVPDRLSGVGGSAPTARFLSALRMFRHDGGDAVFRGAFQAFTDPASLDMSVLGRNLLNEFAVIIDWPKKAVYLVNQRHRYAIIEE